MAEVDIDKILEQNEKKDAQKKKRSTIIFAAMGVAVAAAIAAAVIVAVTTATGEDCALYFPLRQGERLLYNRIGGASEKWQVMEKGENIDNIDCTVMNAIDQSNFYSFQSYYYFSEQGLVLYAVSQNFGEKQKVRMILMPARLKKNAEFEAADGVKGKLTLKEELACPLGLLETVKVDYSGQGVDRTMWFAKDIGIVKSIDRAKNEEVTLLAVEK